VVTSNEITCVENSTEIRAEETEWQRERKGCSAGKKGEKERGLTSGWFSTLGNLEGGESIVGGGVVAEEKTILSMSSVYRGEPTCGDQ